MIANLVTVAALTGTIIFGVAAPESASAADAHGIPVSTGQAGSVGGW